MHILLNGRPVEIDEHATLANLLAAQGYAERRVAVELNRSIVPRSLHAAQRLQPGDRVEIVHAIGGG
jgi:sulfur carrier protein